MAKSYKEKFKKLEDILKNGKDISMKTYEKIVNDKAFMDGLLKDQAGLAKLLGRARNNKGKSGNLIHLLETIHTYHLSSIEQHKPIIASYQEQRVRGIAANISHISVFSDKEARNPQLELLDILHKKWEAKQITDQQWYGALCYVRDQIQQKGYKYESRLEGTINARIAALVSEKRIDTSESAVKQAVASFVQYMRTSPSLARENPNNPIIQELSKGKAVQELAAEAVKVSQLATQDRREAARVVVASYTQEGRADAEYNRLRGLKSKLWQNEARIDQLKEFKAIMSALDSSGVSDNDKLIYLASGLMAIKAKIQAEQPNDPKYVGKTALGKMINKVLEPLKLPDLSSTAQAELIKKYEAFAQNGFKPVQSRIALPKRPQRN